ncbi:MAG TPA: hypothetical protein VGF92_02390 [Stellaceae bacterium]|jgi:hypothetical protein
MTQPHLLPVLAAGLALVLSLDVSIGLVTGRVRGKDGGITRARQPQRFWRYIAGDAVLLVGCFGCVVWGLIAW